MVSSLATRLPGPEVFFGQQWFLPWISSIYAIFAQSLSYIKLRMLTLTEASEAFYMT